MYDYSTEDLPILVRDESAPSQPQELMGTVKKPLWSVSTECAIEFHRVVNDLFPSGTKQLRYVMSDAISKPLTKSWADTKELITYDELINALNTCDLPNPHAEISSILAGVAIGLESISEQSALQKEILEAGREQRAQVHRKKTTASKPLHNDPKTFEEEVEFWRHNKPVDPSTLVRGQKLHEDGELPETNKDNFTLMNRGSIVVFTSRDRDDDANDILSNVIDQIKSQNSMIENIVDGSRLKIDDLNLYIINILPYTDASCYGKGNKAKVEVEELDWPGIEVKIKLVSCQAGDELNSIILKVLLEIYDLVSTTVSGIPMKEESQPGQSVNYDVELLHDRKSHELLKEYGLLSPGSSIIAKNEHGNFNTVKLKWLSPSAKLKSEIFPLFMGSFSATPAYVNSRQAVCLTGFIVNNNKNVMLKVESPPKDIEPNLMGNLISHYLTHEEGTGVMMIQTVAFGKRATLYGHLKQQEREGIKPNLNYTIMNNFMKTLSVVPKLIKPDTDLLVSYEENVAVANRNTSYFPASLKDTFIFNIPEKFEPLLSMMPKPELSPEEGEKCKKWIYTFVTSKTGAEPFTLKALDCSLLSKPSNREEQFRVASEELYQYLRNFVKNSPRHLEIYNLYANLLKFKEISASDLEVYQIGAESPRGRDHRSSSPVAKKPKKLPPDMLWKKGETLNLYTYFNDMLEKEHMSKWRDFVGREKAGDKNPAPLYQHLNLSAAGDLRNPRGGGAGGM